MEIREALAKDIQQLGPLLSELSGHEIKDAEVQNRFEMIQNSSIDKLFVGLLDEKIIGILAFRIRENIEELSRYGEISAIIVDEKYRKQKIGFQLIEYAEAYAKSVHCKGSWLVSGFGREETAHPFYKANGYQATGYRFVKLF